MVAPLGPTTKPTTRYGTRTCTVVCPGVFAINWPKANVELIFDFLEARIWEKWSAADRISRLARATSSLRPVTTKTGSSPRTGVLMYVLVLARNALILHPEKWIISYINLRQKKNVLKKRGFLEIFAARQFVQRLKANQPRKMQGCQLLEIDPQKSLFLPTKSCNQGPILETFYFLDTRRLGLQAIAF